MPDPSRPRRRETLRLSRSGAERARGPWASLGGRADCAFLRGPWEEDVRFLAWISTGLEAPIQALGHALCIPQRCQIQKWPRRALLQGPRNVVQVSPVPARLHPYPVRTSVLGSSLL